MEMTNSPSGFGSGQLGESRRRLFARTARWMIAASATGLGAAMGACGPLRAGQQPGATREVRTLEVYTGFELHGGRMGEAIAKVVRYFNETVGPKQGYGVQHTTVPWGEMNTKVQTVVAAGTPPDAFRGWSHSIPILAPASALTVLDPFIQKDKDYNVADIWPSTVELTRWLDKTVGAPISTQVDFAFFNKGLLRQVGLNPDRTPADLDGWTEWGEKATELGADRSIVRAGFLPPLTGDPQTYGVVFGGRFYDPQAQRVTLLHPGVLRMLEWMKTFVDRYGPGPIEAFRAAYSAANWGRFSKDGAFYIGRFAIWVFPVWLYNDVREFGPGVDFSVLPVPSPKGLQAPPGAIRVNEYFMPAGAKRPEGGWLFLKYMSKDPYVAEHKVLVDSVPPSRRSLASERRFEAQAPWLKMARDDILPKAIAPMVPDLGVLGGPLGRAVAAVRAAEKAPRQALEDAQQEAQADLEEKLRRFGMRR